MDQRVAELEPVIASFGLDALDVEEARRRFHAAASAIPPPEGVDITPTTTGGLHAVSTRPSGSAPAGRILHLHGGGFVLGGVDVQLGVPARLALATGCEVISPEYRLAPEHPCPAATDDALAAYRALLDDGPVAAIAGDSAGGALAVLTAVAARDAGLALPAALVALSPWTDLVGTAPRATDPAFHDAVLPRSFTALAARSYLDGRPADDPAATPTTADLGGLPPTLVHVGGDEVLLGDSVALAGALGAAGVDVTLRVWPSMIHVFVAYPTLAPESDAALTEVGELLGRVGAVDRP